MASEKETSPLSQVSPWILYDVYSSWESMTSTILYICLWMAGSTVAGIYILQGSGVLFRFFAYTTDTASPAQ
jgi:hypothetical protein